jgi:tRNA (guanine-N7-)-methyltransferase
MRNKKYRFACNAKAYNVIEPYLLKTEYPNGWPRTYFQNNNPLVIELGCGNGEYTVGLAQKDYNSNYVGVDIKGDRIWVGSQQAIAMNLKNAAFLRIRAEDLDKFFLPHSVNEIYINFPDPRPKLSDAKKRLVSPRFLDLYTKILIEGGCLHLKTDSSQLFDYALEILEQNDFLIKEKHYDLYDYLEHTPTIQTKYEKKFLSQGYAIKYLKAELHK